MNGSSAHTGWFALSAVAALVAVAAHFLSSPIFLMLDTRQFSRPGSTAFACLLAVVCLLVVVSWLSAATGYVSAGSASERRTAYRWLGYILALNGLNCALIWSLVREVWRDLDESGLANVSRAMVVVASVQFFLALVAAVGQLKVRVEPQTSSVSEGSVSGLDSE